MRINLNDVSWGWSGSSSGGNRKDFGRKSKITSRRIWMVHIPTGIRVNGEVAAGHFSKKEMKEATEAIKTQLLYDLEQKVVNELAKVERNKRRHK